MKTLITKHSIGRFPYIDSKLVFMTLLVDILNRINYIDYQYTCCLTYNAYLEQQQIHADKDGDYLTFYI